MFGLFNQLQCRRSRETQEGHIKRQNISHKLLYQTNSNLTSAYYSFSNLLTKVLCSVLEYHYIPASRLPQVENLCRTLFSRSLIFVQFHGYMQNKKTEKQFFSCTKKANTNVKEKTTFFNTEFIKDIHTTTCLIMWMA